MNTHSDSLRPRSLVAFTALATALAVPFAASVARAQSATWTGSGAGDDWTTPENWTGNTPPANDGTYAVNLNASSGGISNVNTPYDVKQVNFSGSAGAFTLTGSQIDLRGIGVGADTNYLIASSSSTAGLTQTVENNLRMLAAGAFRANTGNLVLKGGVNFNSVGNVRFLAEASRTLTLDGVLTGAGGTIAFNGAGTIAVNGDNTYTGTTKVWGNTTVKLGHSNALGASTGNILLGTENNASAGTPAILTDAAITVARNIRVFTSSSAERQVTLGGAGAHVSTFSGNIFLKSYDVSAIDAMPLTVTAAAGGRVNFTGNITREANATGSRDSLRKTGAGIVALSGTSTYSGATTVDEGVLLIHGTLSNANFGHAPGAVTVESGAALGGNGGTINRDVLIKTGAIFTPGDIAADGVTSLAGALTVNGGLAFENGAQLLFDQGDAVTVNGDLSLGGVLSLSSPESWSMGLHTLFSYTGTLGGLGLTLDPALGAGFALNTSTHGLVQLEVTAIPEPASAAVLLGAFTLATVTVGRRRRR